MSGIEIVIIIGAGYYITKKVKEHRQAKKEQQALLEHGPAQETRAASNTPQQRQQVQVEDEPLPLYSAPTKDLEQASETQGAYNPHLPTYDEVRDEKRRPDQQDSFADQTTQGEGSALPTTFNEILPTSTSTVSTPQPESKRKSIRNKLWKRDSAKAAA